jgi:hypothetical protein
VLQRLASSAVARLGSALPLPGTQSGLRAEDLRRTGNAVGRVVFWLVLALAVMAATERMGMPVVTAWLSGVANYLPRIVVAVLIAAAGLPLSRLAGAAASRAALSAGTSGARRVGKLAEVSAIAVTALIAIETLGIEVSFLHFAILVVLAALLFGAGLAFALGARELVAEILACHYVQRLYHVGQRVEVQGDGGAVTGRILRVVPPCVVLETPAGEVAVPASRFTTGTSRLLASGDAAVRGQDG